MASSLFKKDICIGVAEISLEELGESHQVLSHKRCFALDSVSFLKELWCSIYKKRRHVLLCLCSAELCLSVRHISSVVGVRVCVCVYLGECLCVFMYVCVFVFK